jgi:flagellar assembly factor FliW
MVIDAKDLGMLEIDEKDIVTFEKGLIGLGDLKEFAVLKGDENGIFYWLQSLSDSNVRLVLMDTSKFISDYRPIGENDVISEIGDFSSLEDLLIYNITVIPKNFMDITVNLKAPIVINKKTNKAYQMVCDNEKFPIKYYIQRELNKKNKAGE